MKTIKTLGYQRDHGDGGGSIKLFNDKEHFLMWLQDDEEITRAEALEQYDLIDSGDDPYENGEFNTVNINVDLVNGKLELADVCYVGYGQ